MDDVVIIVQHAVSTAVLHCSACKAELWCTEPSAFVWRHHLSLQIRLKSVAHVWTLVFVLVMNEVYSLQIQLNKLPYFVPIYLHWVHGFKKEIWVITFTQNVCISTFRLNVCTNRQAHTSKLDKEWPFYSPKEKKRLLFPFSSFLSCSPVSSLHLSLLLSLSLSLSALSNSVIIKAKEYLWVSTHSISLSTLWLAIILCRHAHIHTDVHNTHKHTCKYVSVDIWTHTHTHTLLYQVVTELLFDW